MLHKNQEPKNSAKSKIKKLKVQKSATKKFAALFLCLLFSLSLIACGQKAEDQEEFELKPATVESSEESPAESSESTPESSAELAEQRSEESSPTETLEIESEEFIEEQIGDKDPSTGLDLNQEPGEVMIVGNNDPLLQRLSSFSQYKISDQLDSATIQRARIAADDEAYAAELQAQAEAAAQAQAAAAYAQQQQAAAAAVAQQQSNQNQGGTVSSQGSAGLHDTYAGAMTIINLLNQHRASLGIHQLVNDAVMQEIALVRVPEVGVSYRNSGDATGHTHGGVFALTWIASVYGANSGLAENTGFFTSGTKTPEQIFTAFINSPAHYSTMVSTAYTRVGIALYYDPIDNREYVVMNFGN